MTGPRANLGVSRRLDKSALQRFENIISTVLRPFVRESYDINEVPDALANEIKEIEADAKKLSERVLAFIDTFNEDQEARAPKEPEAESTTLEVQDATIKAE